jgi:hypothetical protein
MVWTEVSWLLAAVAAVIILVALVAILLTEIRRPAVSRFSRLDRRRLPGNADSEIDRPDKWRNVW